MNTKDRLTSISPGALSRRQWLMVVPILIAFIAAYFVNVHRNPPGYYIDESSVSYNAYTISQTGRDEHGQPWPLYFRAFGEYKNPVYVYLLAAIYRITGPSILAARLLSATAGVLAALALGLLALRISERRDVGILVVITALLTPWLFEMSRVVWEVALYPLVIVLFLLCAHHASTKLRWSAREIICLATTLALLTYTYSIGRLLGPLFALGLIFFATRGRRAAVMATWALYAVTLLPLLLFQRSNPGALTGRFTSITYLQPPYTFADSAWTFAKHYLHNLNPLRLFITGDPNLDQIAHLYGTPLLLAATGLLAVGGLVLTIRQGRNHPWWRLLIYCLLVSAVPASLTKEYVHMLRLAPLPVFVVVLTIPAIQWLLTNSRRRRAALLLLVLLTLGQGGAFLWKFEASANSPRRLRHFDHGYPAQILSRALSMTERPIYLADALAIPGYIQAYWYGTLWGVSPATFVRLAPDEPAPDGALVISTEENCPRCRIIAASEFYTLYLASGPPVKRVPLPDSGFQARLGLVDPISVLPSGGRADFIVSVSNSGNAVWHARERSGGVFQVSAGNHWLDREGNTVINDDGRSALLSDLLPGQEMKLKLTVNAPKEPGSYLLEIDMLQEGVSWFQSKGSTTIRVPVRVE